MQDTKKKQTRENPPDSTRIWKGYELPIRQAVLWGVTEEGEPGYLILYGKQGGTRQRDTNDSRPYSYYSDYDTYYLDEDVTYTYYAVFSGQKKHLPSFPEVKTWEDYRGNIQLYYAGGGRGYYYGTKVESFYPLEEEKITLPYCQELSYSECAERVMQQKHDFSGFQILSNPNELLLLDEEYQDSFETICQMISYPNRYIRKKRMAELLDTVKNPSLYQQLITIGSTETLSGLFLELAKRHNPMLVEEAKQICEETPFDETNYYNGLIRCATLYINSMDETKRQKQAEHIKRIVSQIDMPLIHVAGKDIPPGTKLEGFVYRKYSLKEELRKEHYHSYYENGRWRSKVIPSAVHYQANAYNDGRELDIIAVKNTIQEAEILGLADALGEIAYYMDAPRLTYYFQGNGQGNAHKYFTRYLKRVLHAYAKNDSNRYMEAMKALFMRYESQDYVCKFKGNFQFNKFIKEFLYGAYDWKAPSSDEDYMGRYQYLCNDQLLLIEGRYELYSEIWDAHLFDTAQIAASTDVEDIAKACYFILEDTPNRSRLDTELTEQQMIALSTSCYEPLAALGRELFAKQLEGKTEIDPDLLFALLQSPDRNLQEIAVDYITQKKGQIPPFLFVRMLTMEERELVSHLWNKSIFDYTPDKYMLFLEELVKQKNQLQTVVLSEEEINVMRQIGDRITAMEYSKQKEFFQMLCRSLFFEENLPLFLSEFFEEVLFRFDTDTLKKLLQDCPLSEPNIILSQRNNRILSLYRSLQSGEIPSAALVADITKNGNAGMVRLLIEILEDNKSALAQKKDVFLVLAELTIARFHQLAEDVLDEAKGQEKNELVLLLLDSPVEQAYQLGLSQAEVEYNGQMPKEWLKNLMEHPSDEVKAFLSQHIDDVLEGLGNGDKELFFYYVKTLLYLPNKIAKGKQKVYQVLPRFICHYPLERERMEQILLDIGGSNCKTDAEHALVALALIRNEVQNIEG